MPSPQGSEHAAEGVLASTSDVANSSPARTRPLRAVLVIGDLIALTCVGLIVGVVTRRLWGEDWNQVALRTLVAVSAGGLLLLWSGLYRATVCAVRRVELSKLARVAAGYGAVGYLVGLTPRRHPWAAVAAAAATFVALAIHRSFFRAWVAALHRRGVCTRSVVVVAPPRDADVILAHLGNFPEIGYRVCAVVNPASVRTASAQHPPGVVGEIIEIARRLDVTGLLIASSALPSPTTAQLTRSALALGLRVQLWSGVPGVDPQRFHALPLGHQAAFAVEPPRMSTTALFVKRVLDLTLSSLLLVATAPLLLVGAVWIKLEDRGPVIFRQTRIGKDGRRFTLFKLRSMVVDAEARLAEFRDRNERVNSPLFKLEADPRITRAGRFLRATSIDELPQLVNVLRGDMTLVGPRPALADEVARFDEDLLRRLRVTPGLTGLWQVRARENPSFAVYRDLDLFYVENWSLSMDLTILATTVIAVVIRALRRFRPLQPSPTAPAPNPRPVVQPNAFTGIAE
jgi:exopolysaccharide biosynthesis polyprenyl glycosylphosphotransferase